MDVRICWEGWKEWLCHCYLFVQTLILLLKCNLTLFCSCMQLPALNEYLFRKILDARQRKGCDVIFWLSWFRFNQFYGKQGGYILSESILRCRDSLRSPNLPIPPQLLEYDVWHHQEAGPHHDRHTVQEIWFQHTQNTRFSAEYPPQFSAWRSGRLTLTSRSKFW